jgi:RecB family endonuclease NucS
MGDELVFTVTANVAAAAKPITLAEAGLREREHLQELVLAHPEILGKGVLIVTSEFDQWASAAGPERDRLDVLGLAPDGRLVVAELKRDTAPDTVEMQAIKYAAMASRFDIERLGDAHA